MLGRQKWDYPQNDTHHGETKKKALVSRKGTPLGEKTAGVLPAKLLSFRNATFTYFAVPLCELAQIVEHRLFGVTLSL